MIPAASISRSSFCLAARPPDSDSTRRQVSTIYSEHWFRCPYQNKGNDKNGGKHIIVVGSMKDFLIDYIPKDSVNINDTQQIGVECAVKKQRKNYKVIKIDTVTNESSLCTVDNTNIILY